MDKVLKHINDLTRHIDLVRDNCLLLGVRLVEAGEIELGVQLIERGYKHDISKFSGIEFKYLHNGPDVPIKELELAIKEHQSQNDHHPEFWTEGVEDMSRAAIGEMVADWFARSQEFGTSLRNWIDEEAIVRYNINKRGKQYKWIKEFLDILLNDPFKKGV
jgi:hypothetical protein